MVYVWYLSKEPSTLHNKNLKLVINELKTRNK